MRSQPIARNLAKRGFEVTLMCISDKARLHTTISMDENVRIVETPDLFSGRLRSGWDPWNTIHRIKYLRDKHYNLIHAFETRPATIYPVLHYLRTNKTPLVIDWNDWWGRGGLISELRPKWYQVLFGGLETYYEEHFRSLADSTTVISSALAERAESLGIPRGQIFKILGGVDSVFFTPLSPEKCRRQFGLPETATVLAFSAADVNMDTDLALSCLQDLVKSHPNTILILTGNKPAFFDKAVASMNLSRSVFHLGFLPYNDLPNALSCADIFLLPFRDSQANRGRWPNKITEYMSMARPTVTNPVGEIKTLFSNHRVGLTAAASAKDMADKIRLLLDNPALREELGRNARQLALKQFSWATTIDRLEQVYLDTIKRFTTKRDLNMNKLQGKQT